MPTYRHTMEKQLCLEWAETAELCPTDSKAVMGERAVEYVCKF